MARMGLVAWGCLLVAALTGWSDAARAQASSAWLTILPALLQGSGPVAQDVFSSPSVLVETPSAAPEAGARVSAGARMSPRGGAYAIAAGVGLTLVGVVGGVTMSALCQSPGTGIAGGFTVAAGLGLAIGGGRARRHVPAGATTLHPLEPLAVLATFLGVTALSGALLVGSALSNCSTIFGS